MGWLRRLRRRGDTLEKAGEKFGKGADGVVRAAVHALNDPAVTLHIQSLITEIYILRNQIKAEEEMKGRHLQELKDTLASKKAKLEEVCRQYDQWDPRFPDPKKKRPFYLRWFRREEWSDA